MTEAATCAGGLSVLTAGADSGGTSVQERLGALCSFLVLFELPGFAIGQAYAFAADQFPVEGAPLHLSSSEQSAGGPHGKTVGVVCVGSPSPKCINSSGSTSSKQ